MRILSTEGVCYIDSQVANLLIDIDKGGKVTVINNLIRDNLKLDSIIKSSLDWEKNNV
jgi:UDP-glucose 4-epimerase|tara:strand:- start:356 stop:529 length:174 start_codon:yes stop_codon:yes gene_type:complete